MSCLNPTLKQLGEEFLCADVLRIVPLPYPFKRAHFKLDMGGGAYALRWLTQAQCERCVQSWQKLALPSVDAISTAEALRAYTLYRQVSQIRFDPAPFSYTPETRRLIRLCFEKSPHAIREALSLMTRFFARGCEPGTLSACALRIASELPAG